MNVATYIIPIDIICGGVVALGVWRALWAGRSEWMLRKYRARLEGKY